MYTRLCWVSDTTCSVLFNITIIYQPQSTGTFVVPNTVCLVCCHNGVDGVPSCACIRLPESFCFGSGRWSFPIFALFVLRQPSTEHFFLSSHLFPSHLPLTIAHRHSKPPPMWQVRHLSNVRGERGCMSTGYRHFTTSQTEQY